MTQALPHFAIVIAERDGSEKRELFGDAPVSIGRVHGNEVVLHRSNVSKRHARLSSSEDRFIITDLGSTNGTYVNQTRITRATAVLEGDRIYIGDFMLRLERVGSDGNPVAGASVPPTSTRWPSIPPAAPSPSSERGNADSEPPRSGSEPPGAPRLADAADLPDPGESVDRGSVRGPRDAAMELVRRVLAAVDDGSTDPAIVKKRELERCLREELKSGGHSDVVSDQARSELFEWGLVGDALADAAVWEIRLSGAHDCEVVRGRHTARADRAFASPRAYELVVGRLLEAAALRAPSGWVIEGQLGEAWRLTALAHGADSVVRLTRCRVAESDLRSWVDRGALSRAASSFLTACVAGRCNLLVIGPDARHAAQFADALLSAAEPGPPCLVLCEEPLPGTGEAQARRLHLDESGAASVDRLIELVESSRARLVLDSLHSAARSSFVHAAASGLSGVVGLLRGRGVRAGLQGLLATQVAGQALATSVVRASDASAELVAAAFDVVVELTSGEGGAPVIASIEELCGASDGQGLRRASLFAREPAGLAATGELPGEVRARLAARGVSLELSAFAVAPPSGVAPQSTLASSSAAD